MSVRQGFKQTDIGEIPEEWDTINLREILSDITNGISTYQSDVETGYPVTRIETISDEVINPNRVKFLQRVSKQDLDRYRLRKGDILFSNINSIKHIAKTAIYEGKPPLLIHGMNLLLLRPNREKVYPKFLLYLLKFEKTRNKFRSLAKKAINQASLNQKEVGSVKLPLPSLPKQQKIASILSTVDEVIQKTDEVINKAEELKRGLMLRLLTRGIGHTRFKQTKLGEIPESWKVSTIGQECTVGTGGTPSRRKPDYFNGNIPWVKTTELNCDMITSTEECITEKALEESNAKIFPRGTLLIAMYGLEATGTRGRCAILGVKAATNQACAAIQSSGRIYIPFLFYYYQFLGNRIMSLAEGTKRKNLSLRLVRSIKIPVPPMGEQAKIAGILSEVEHMIKRERQKFEQFEKLRKGLMQVLLTGKVRVKVD